MIQRADFHPAQPLLPGEITKSTCLARSDRCKVVASHS
jgi:hypothetical protein